MIKSGFLYVCLCNEQKYPVKYMGRGKQFELALFDLAAMMFPFSPLFASELWAGLVNTPNRQLPIPQVKDTIVCLVLVSIIIFFCGE